MRTERFAARLRERMAPRDGPWHTEVCGDAGRTAPDCRRCHCDGCDSCDSCDGNKVYMKANTALKSHFRNRSASLSSVFIGASFRHVRDMPSNAALSLSRSEAGASPRRATNSSASIRASSMTSLPGHPPSTMRDSSR